MGNKFQIKSLDDLIKVCENQKEIKLKYELETNFNLVSFEQKRIEISFNENLDKNFIKDLSARLFDWTSDRWIISLSKKTGEKTRKEFSLDKKKEKINNAKKTSIYKNFLNTFSDAELIEVEKKD